MPTLYLVATPIGNLEDMTFRAVRTLKEVDLVAAEDTRTTGRLLKHFEIETKLTSYHEYSEPEKRDALIERLATQDIALVTDAGTPSVSDPGYRLVRAAIDAGVTVCPIPGANAATTALVASGLPTDAYLFLGFLPRQASARQQALSAVKSHPHTLVLYESPHRLLKLLADMRAVLGARQIAVGRELTKLHEEIWRGSITNALAYFGDGAIRGEITIVVEGERVSAETWTEDQIRSAIQQHLAAGHSKKETASLIAKASGWRKKQVYALVNQVG